MTPDFQGFAKMARLNRDMLITEKIDGTNSQIRILPTDGRPIQKAIHEWSEGGVDYAMLAGSRTRWITPEDDNFGFAAWVEGNAEELRRLGPGGHFGEWWGRGIQRNYGLKERRFSLFNVQRWCPHGQEPQRIPMADPRIVKMQDMLPPCCHLVPVLYRGLFDTAFVNSTLTILGAGGSQAAPGFPDPEGIVVFHIAGNTGFKVTLKNDNEPKGTTP